MKAALSPTIRLATPQGLHLKNLAIVSPRGLPGCAAGLDYTQATKADWAAVLAARRQFIGELRQHPAITGRADVQRALTAATGRLTTITASICCQFVQAWRQDVGAWQARLAMLESGLTPTAIAKKLRLASPVHAAGL